MNNIGALLVGEKRRGSVHSKSNRITLAFTYFFYFGQLGIFVPYVGLFLDDRGYDSNQIGILLACVALSRILGPSLWANIADKTGKVGEVLRLGCLLAFIVFLAIYFVFDFWLLTLTFCLMMMFWTAVLPQLEVITVKATAKAKGGYGKLRLWGSIGFIVCSLIIGKAIDFYGAQSIVMASSFALLALYLCSLFVIAPIHKKDHEGHSIGEWKKALSLVFILFLLGNLLLQVSFGSYYNFFSLYMQDLGYSGFETGIFITLGVLSEIFIFIYAGRLLKRFNVMVLLGLSILLTGIRWLALAFFAHELWVIVLSQIIHAFSFGLTHVASVYFLTHFFPASFQSRAQALYISISFGIGSALGSYIAGRMWLQGVGSQESFVFSAIVAFVGGVIMFVVKTRGNIKAPDLQQQT